MQTLAMHGYYNNENIEPNLKSYAQNIRHEYETFIDK